MGVVFNGVTITAGTNKFYFNGTSVKDVYFNGVHVWAGLPTFSAGTGYQAVSATGGYGKLYSWHTAATRTFTGGDGSSCSVRSYGQGYTDNSGESTSYVGHGRVLKNGSVIATNYTFSWRGEYSSFVTTAANNGDVFTLQYKLYHSLSLGGGQIYTAEDSSGYWT